MIAGPSSQRLWRAMFAVALVLQAASAAQPPAAPAAFRFERPIAANGQGPRRLAVDVPLLAGINRDLSDLRLFDANAREIPHLLLSRPSAEPAWRPAVILPVAPVEVDKRKESGFEADIGEIQTVDRLRIDGLPPPFLKRVRLEGSGDRVRWTLLVAEGTLFDLPDEKLRQTELSFAAGAYRYLRVTWDDTNSGRVPPPRPAVVRLGTSTMSPPPLTAMPAVQRRPSEPGRSRYRIRLPGPHLPIVALEIDLGGGHVLRDVSAYEARLSGAEAVPVLLGGATLRRVVQGSLVAASLRMPITPPLEPQIDLVVDDGDNPPLDVRGVQAIFADLPWIYFESDGTALTARYGNPALGRPRYDLEAVRDTVHIEAVVDAAWGEPRPRSATENAAGAAPFLPFVGASLDPAVFQFVRPIPPGGAGLIALPLDAAVLSHSAGAPGGFADVRVIDASDRQVPYLVERAAEPLSIDLRLERLSQLPRWLDAPSSKPSVYRVPWPYERLPSPRLVLTTSARVFQRSLTVGIEREPDRRHRDPWFEPLARTAWAHADQDRPASALTIPLPSADAKELLLIVEEGDNSPLPIAAARVLLPAYRLRFFREQDAALRLAYGRSDLAPPRYDLALLAPQLLGAAVTEIVMEGERQAVGGAAPAAALLSPRIFWGVLGLAVLVLVGLIVRLLKKDTPTTGARPPLVEFAGFDLFTSSSRDRTPGSRRRDAGSPCRAGFP